MKQTGAKILAAGSTGGRNEVKFFEGVTAGLDADDDEESDQKRNDLNGPYKPTYSITDINGGVQSLDFSFKNNKLVFGTSKGVVAWFKLKIVI